MLLFVHSVEQGEQNIVLPDIEHAEPGQSSDLMVTYVVAASNEQNFRAITVACPSADAGDTVSLPQDAQDALMVVPGDNVICVRI